MQPRIQQAIERAARNLCHLALLCIDQDRFQERE
jgi:hypothetical protein